MAIKIVEKLGPVFEFYLDNVFVAENARNDVFVKPTGCDFKTSEGANIFQKQNIQFADIVIEDILGVQNTPTNRAALFTMLENIHYFDWFRVKPVTVGTTGVILTKGMSVKLTNVSVSYLQTNIDGTGLGRLELEGWEVDPNIADRFSLGYNPADDSTPYNFSSLAGVRTGGYADSTLPDHEHEWGSEHYITGWGTGGADPGHSRKRKTGLPIKSDGTPYNATPENGVGKNIPPYYVDVWLRRTVDLTAASLTAVNRFKNLLDAFDYQNNDGKIPMVDEANNRLIPVNFYNKRLLTELEDVAISTLTPIMQGKYLGIELINGTPKVVLKDVTNAGQVFDDEIIHFDPITRSGNEFTIPANGTWRIDGTLNTNATAIVTDIALASAGTNKLVVSVAKVNNEIETVIGDESTDIARMPDLPANSLIITTYYVTDSDIVPVDPITSTPFITKQSKATVYVNLSGAVVNLRRDNRTKYEFRGNVTSIKGLDSVSTAPATDTNYANQKWTFKNSSDVVCRFYHNHASGSIKFRFPTGSDFFLPTGTTIEFDYNEETNTLNYIGTYKKMYEYLELEFFEKGEVGGEANILSVPERGDFARGRADINTVWDRALYLGGDVTDRANYIPVAQTDITDLLLT